MTTIGKYRHLAQNSTPDGKFVILAIDHRANLRASLDHGAPHPLSDDEFSAFKQQVVRHLAPLCSAVLIDPAYGIGPGLVSGALPGQVGLLSPLEVTNYDVHPSQREVARMPHWSVEQIKRSGGTGVKLLVFYHPDAAAAPAKRDAVAQIVDECARYDLPFFLEPLVHSLDPSIALSSSEKRQLVVETARTFSALGIDVLKTEFPLDIVQESDRAVWRAALAELDAACEVPWALLSAGVDYATFEQQAALACAAGASGVIVGRAVWAEAVRLQGAAREEFLSTTARARMQALSALAAQQGQDWRQRITAPTLDYDWYTQYAGFGE